MLTKLRCPICNESLDDRFTCSNDHVYHTTNGVLELLTPDFGAKLHHFTTHFSRLREQEARKITDPALYPYLPHALAHQPEWRLRTYDLAILQKRLPQNTTHTILDLGAWNGWLSYHLTKMGHLVTAIDYFADPLDGLGAMQYYPLQWRAIQMDLENLSVFAEPFDCILLNRCIQFMRDPVAFLKNLRKYVKPDGMMLLTGLQFFFQPQEKAHQVADYRERIQQTYGFEIFLNPTKGYLDEQDWTAFKQLGIRLFPYPQTWVANLKSRLKPTLPRHYYGIWH